MVGGGEEVGEKQGKSDRSATTWELDAGAGATDLVDEARRDEARQDETGPLVEKEVGLAQAQAPRASW